MTTRPTILLTGFGPFPGVEVNASGLLVPQIARAARRRFKPVRFVVRTVPTEWVRGPSRVAAALAGETPLIALHFGVSNKAHGFVIEKVAANTCKPVPDGAGHLPPLDQLDPGAPANQAVTLPVKEIVKRLRAAGFPAEPSGDAGGYLCNAVLFCSLRHATEQHGASQALSAGFIHIPSTLAGHGPNLKQPMPGCPLTHAEVIAGGLEIIAACLDQR